MSSPTHTVKAFPYLLRPALLAARNRARRRRKGDLLRAGLFGGVGLAVWAGLFGGSFWLTLQVGAYGELGDYLLRLGLSWLFLTFLSFLAFSGVITSLSTFFLADDLRLLFAAPVAARRLFHARLVRTIGQASWMVVVFMVPVLAGVGVGRCAPLTYYATAILTVAPFVVIPVVAGSAVTMLLVNTFPARRARDLLMLMGLLFAAGLVLVLRFVQPERLLRVDSLPDVTDYFATLNAPVTPLLPSFWAGEALFAGLLGEADLLHASALWTTALASVLLLGMAAARWHFPGYSRSQEASRVRVSRLRAVDRLLRLVPCSAVGRELLVKDVKTFLRDVSQWSQLLLLLALVVVYLYNFRVLDLDQVPNMTLIVKNLYAFLNVGMAGFVMATIAVRFVFPAVSAEGQAFWIIRTAPVSMRAFLWSKFWTALVPMTALAEGLTLAANGFMGIDPFLNAVSVGGIGLMSVALVGLAIGMGARYPRFAADTPAQVAGSYGGVVFMIVAVFYILVMIALLGWPSSVYLWARARAVPLAAGDQILIGSCFVTALASSLAAWLWSLRSGVRALTAMEGMPA